MRRLLFVIGLIFCLCFSACVRGHADFSGVLAGPFEAELVGEVCGLAFEARLVLDACGAEGVAPATLTFYAPSELAGTQLSRDAAGEIVMCYDGVSLGNVGGVGLLLFSLFPTAEEVKQATVNDRGNTVVLFESAQIEFSPDGVPLFVKNDDVAARVISWNKP